MLFCFLEIVKYSEQALYKPYVTTQESQTLFVQGTPHLATSR